MARSGRKGRRVVSNNSNVYALPTRVRKLRVASNWSPTRPRLFSFEAWDTTKTAVERATKRPNLRLVEDRRQFHPDRRNRQPATFRNRDSRRVTAPKYLAVAAPAALAFKRPRDVVACVRRQIRKEVIHAKRKAGRRGQRRPRWNWLSRIWCKKGG